MHADNNFITLTYDNEHLPKDLSLDKTHLQKFIKRYRKQYGKIRYLACGEYGTQTKRPHYHLIVYGHDWPDRIPIKKNHQNDIIYTSEKLGKIWTFGHHAVGDVTFESAAYVARYVLDKHTGKNKTDKYWRYNETTGEAWEVAKEFNTMSRRPGIGKQWYDKYKSDCYPSDNLHLRGQEMRPPKYYDRAYELEQPEVMKTLKKKRVAMRDEANNTPERLATRKIVAEAKISTLKRPNT